MHKSCVIFKKLFHTETLNCPVTPTRINDGKKNRWDHECPPIKGQSRVEPASPWEPSSHVLLVCLSESLSVSACEFLCGRGLLGFRATLVGHSDPWTNSSSVKGFTYDLTLTFIDMPYHVIKE